MQERTNSSINQSSPLSSKHSPVGPEIIFQEIQKITSNPSDAINTPLEIINKNYPDIKLESNDDSKKYQELIQEKINQLRMADFTYRYTAANGEEVLIKDVRDTPATALNPMHPREAEIQSLRYLRGMLLIIENNSFIDARISSLVNRYYTTYIRNMSASPQLAATHTAWLAEEFAKLLVDENTDMDHARRQITMARDLGILLEKHPAICTISKHDDTITIEKSSQIKISDAFYDKHFNPIASQPWFENALNYAGISAYNTDAWLVNYFKNNLANLKKTGVPAAPSARWLPLPANNQLLENHVINQVTHENLSTSFIRMGSLAAYSIKDSSIQEELAIDQLKEIIKNQLANKIKEFKSNYSAIIPTEKLVNFDFYVDYQSLLTTHFIESALPHTDNNSKFYNLTKKAMAMLSNDVELKQIAAEQGANLIFYHTNLSINKHADWFSARKYSDRITAIQYAKITAMENIAGSIDKDKWDAVTDKKIKYEIAMRITAGSYLKAMLRSNDAPSTLKHYQRHIMIAALEFLTMGDQALALAGCKSARDRTAVFAAAVKTMQENPTAMRDWKVLSAGISKSLMEGHHFRSMSHHVAAVKVNLVHSEFMSRLPTSVQADITATRKFTNTLRKYSPPEADTHKSETILSKHTGSLFSNKFKNMDVELPDEMTWPKP